MKRLLLIALLPLAGCVTPGQHVQQTPRPTAADDPSKPCYDSIAYDKRFVALREKIAINLRADRPSLEMLSDRSIPTEEEKAALSVWLKAREMCFDQGASFRAQYAPPQWRATMGETQTRVNLLTARLYSGQITYGEFNQARASNSSESQQRLATVEQQEREASAASAEQEENRRRAALGMALQNMQNQQALQQQQMLINQQRFQQTLPRQTTCQRIGNQTSCTTY